MALFTTLFLSLLLFLHVTASENVLNEKVRSENLKESIQSAIFSAEFWNSAQYYPDETLRFNKAITNVGELYDVETGEFSCPQGGLYVFIWNLAKSGAIATPGMRAIGRLRDGENELKYGPKSSYDGTVSSGVSEMTSVLECSGDPVSIIAQPWTDDPEGTTFFWGEMSTFSGFPLREGIAFTAELSQDQQAAAGERIEFDNVISNEGGYYDVSNYEFRCPDDGLYVFSVSTHTRDPATPWSVSRLMMEGQVVMQGPMTDLATESYDSGSASSTTVLQCTKDAYVYVEAQASHDYPKNSYGQDLTTFTGFKLYDIDANAVAFSVVMSQNYTSTISNDPVTFDEVITNVGDAFDTSTSSFVCPDDAYYLFTWNAVSTDESTFINLHVDGEEVKRSITNLFRLRAGTSGSAAQSIIWQCHEGSELQIVIEYYSRAFLGGYTSFSGYKLPG